MLHQTTRKKFQFSLHQARLISTTLIFFVKKNNVVEISLYAESLYLHRDSGSSVDPCALAPSIRCGKGEWWLSVVEATQKIKTNRSRLCSSFPSTPLWERGGCKEGVEILLRLFSIAIHLCKVYALH